MEIDVIKILLDTVSPGRKKEFILGYHKGNDPKAQSASSWRTEEVGYDELRSDIVISALGKLSNQEKSYKIF